MIVPPNLTRFDRNLHENASICWLYGCPHDHVFGFCLPATIEHSVKRFAPFCAAKSYFYIYIYISGSFAQEAATTSTRTPSMPTSPSFLSGRAATSLAPASVQPSPVAGHRTAVEDHGSILSQRTTIALLIAMGTFLLKYSSFCFRLVSNS